MTRIWNAITAAKNVVGNVFFLVVVTFIIAILFMGDRIEVPDRGALVLDPTGILVEETRLADPLAEVLGTANGASETRTRDVIEALTMASGDDRITHVVLDLDDLQGGSVAALLEVGDAIDSVRTAGKPVYTWESSFTQAQYLLAAHADAVFLDARGLNPLGPVFLSGLGVFPTFYRSALEKLQVHVHVFRAGLYKSAVEPYLRDTMSDETKQETKIWLGDLWGQYLARIGSRRNLEVGALARYSTEYATRLETASMPNQIALDAGLIDAVLTVDEWREHLKSQLGDAPGASNSIRMGAYLAAARPPVPVAPTANDTVAVVTMSGVILDGKQPPGAIGSRSVLPLLERARKNRAIKALVVRVDSAGGSASASEEIRVGLAAVQDAGKPVVVSMAGTAASGGYWLASTANRIVAAPSTITGSIGTFITFPTFEASLAAIGINSDGVGTTPLAGALDPFRALNPIVSHTLQASVAHTYARFTGLVTQGRNLEPGVVDTLAQGRVFSGASALDAGLVDALGNLSDAIESAAQLAGAENYTVTHLERALSPREVLLREISRVSLKLGIAASGAGGSQVGEGFRHLALSASELAKLTREAAAQGRGSLHVRCMTCEVRL